MSVLQEGSSIGTYSVQSLIKQNEYTETYRVVDKDNNPYFVKLFVMKRTPVKLLDDSSHEVVEIALLQKIQHENLVSYITHGTIDTMVGECQYVVTNYFTGEVLADKIAREGKLDLNKALDIFTGILHGLECLHKANICHNDITPANIMLSDTLEGAPEIIDMGHASKACSGNVPFVTSDLDIQYSANATAAGIFNEHTDIFSAFAVLFALLTGHAPWEPEEFTDDRFALRMNRMKQFRINNPLDVASLMLDDRVKNFLMKGLSLSLNDGYPDVEEVLFDIGHPESPVKPNKKSNGAEYVNNEEKKQTKAETQTIFEVKTGTGHGFDDIAGMHDLKNLLQRKVIFVIQNKELASQYKLTPPNGLLLYGPPGCGKTFFAEKFAEQTSFNFMLIKSSDLASTFIHGTQEKIGELFRQAEKNAPTVLCFDEFDAFVPNRSLLSDQHVSGEVNEFLSQLNNCSQRGIFVIATTNRPDRIDPAVLRTGRIDRHVYVPMPDKEARREMFAIHLKGRPCEEDKLDLDLLAELTEGYIASDIAYIVNDAAMTAAFTHSVITQELLGNVIQYTKPSINKDVVKMYDKIREEMDGIERRNMESGIGFKLR